MLRCLRQPKKLPRTLTPVSLARHNRRHNSNDFPLDKIVLSWAYGKNTDVRKRSETSEDDVSPIASQNDIHPSNIASQRDVYRVKSDHIADTLFEDLRNFATVGNTDGFLRSTAAVIKGNFICAVVANSLFLYGILVSRSSDKYSTSMRSAAARLLIPTVAQSPPKEPERLVFHLARLAMKAGPTDAPPVFVLISLLADRPSVQLQLASSGVLKSMVDFVSYSWEACSPNVELWCSAAAALSTMVLECISNRMYTPKIYQHPPEESNELIYLI